MPLRFSTVSPQEIAEVARLRDMHRGRIPRPEHPGAVPEGVEEQAVDVVKSRVFVVGLEKAYVKSHSRKLPSGRVVTIGAYFNKRTAKEDDSTRKRRPKNPPPSAAQRTGLTPEQLAHRLVRHVREGTLTHEEAEANVAHLERRAQRGQGLEHGHGPAWTHEHLKEFVEHARGGLKEHRQEQHRKQQAETERQAREKAHAEQEEELKRWREARERKAEEDARFKQEQESRERENAQRRERRQRQKAEKQQREEQEKPKEQASTDLMHADYSQVKETANRILDERKFHAVHFKEAPPLIQAVLRKVAPLVSVNPKGRGLPQRGSYFAPSARSVAFRPKSKEKRYPDYAGPVWRHEYGHHVDYELGGQGPHYASSQVFAAMEQDRAVLLKPQPSPEAINHTIFDRDSALYRAGSGRAQRTDAVVDAWQAHGFTAEDLASLDGEQWRTRSMSHHARVLEAWERQDAKAFFTELPSTTHHGMLQDLIGAVTRGAIKLDWAHPDSYYGSKTQYRWQHGTEAYANWFSTHGAVSPVWAKVLEHFAPATNKAFTELTHRWLTTTI